MSIPHLDRRQQASTSSTRNFSDEPPWSPSLLEAIQEERRCYLVADKADAERMTAYGLLTLDIPAVEHLTLDILKPLSYITTYFKISCTHHKMIAIRPKALSCSI